MYTYKVKINDMYILSKEIKKIIYIGKNVTYMYITD